MNAIRYGFVVHDVEQRTDEWRALRLGRLTGSRAGVILAKPLKDGSEPAGRRNLRLALVLERLTHRSQESAYQSPAMLTGIEREADAFAVFEGLTGQIVQRSGFLSHPELMAGASVDGYMNEYRKLLSIKCRQPPAHLEFLRTGKIPADAMAQIVHELWLTGAEEHEYFSWNPDFEEGLQAKSIIVPRDETAINAYELMARAFLADVDRETEEIRALRLAVS